MIDDHKPHHQQLALDHSIKSVLNHLTVVFFYRKKHLIHNFGSSNVINDVIYTQYNIAVQPSIVMH